MLPYKSPGVSLPFTDSRGRVEKSFHFTQQCCHFQSGWLSQALSTLFYMEEAREEVGQWTVIAWLIYHFAFLKKKKHPKYYCLFSGYKSSHSDCRKYRENIKNKIKTPYNITVFGIFPAIAYFLKTKNINTWWSFTVCIYVISITRLEPYSTYNFVSCFFSPWHYKVAEAAVFKYASVM